MTDRSTTDRLVGVVLLLAAIVSLQFGAALAKDLVTTIGAGSAVVLRVGSAAIATGLVVRPALRAFRQDQRIAAAVLGLTMACMNVSFYLAIERLPLGITVAIEFSGPLSVAIWYSRQRRDLIWVASAAAGIILLTPFSGSGLDRAGVGWALAAGFWWAAYIVASDRAGRATSGLEVIPLSLAIAALVSVGPAVVDGGLQRLTPTLIATGVAVGILSSALPYSLELEALRRIPNGTFGLMLSLEPMVAALAGWVVLGELISPRQLLAIGLILVANVGAGRPAVIGVDP